MAAGGAAAGGDVRQVEEPTNDRDSFKSQAPVSATHSQSPQVDSEMSRVLGGKTGSAGC